MLKTGVLCKVGFDDLKVECIVGVRPWERQQEQDLFIDMRVGVDVNRIGESDSLATTVDYGVLAQGIAELIQKGKFRLVETLAVNVLDWTFAQFDVSWVWIRVRKPSALSGNVVPVVELERWAD